MAGDAAGQDKRLRVVAPADPPMMTATVAAALLRLIRRVVDRRTNADTPTINDDDRSISAEVTEREAG
jgi:hypothetical protein